MLVSNFERAVQAVPHLYTEHHAHIVYGLIRWLRPKSVVEVGAFCGYLSCWIAKALYDNGYGNLTVIDDFSLNPEAQGVLTNSLATFGLANIVQVVSGDSGNPDNWPGEVDMAVIDGNHNFEYAYGDAQKAVDRGAHCLCFHDTVGWWGPAKVMEEADILFPNFNLIEAPFDSGWGVLVAKFNRPEPMYNEKEHASGIVVHN